MTEPDADADLIDRLYEGGGDSELDGLRMVRGLVARVRDEMPGVEPPQAVSARLLQAAERPTTVAAVEPAREGLWARFRAWFGGVAMHPGMAAAATLVIVAGAAAIWMRQGGKAATPTVTSEQSAGEGEPAATAPELDELANRGDKLEEVATADVRREAVIVEGDAPTVRPADTTKPPPRKSKPTSPSSGGDSTGGDATGEGPVEGFADKGGQAAGSGSGSGPGAQDTKPTVTTKVGGKGTPTPDAVPPAPPPPPPSDNPAPSTDDDEGQGAPSDAELARQLTKRAIAAAKKQDCTSVDALGKKVKALDPDYYASDFVRQRDIAACRAVSK